MARTRALVIVVAGLALSAGCGSGGAETPPDTPAASSSPAPPSTSSPSVSASPSPSPEAASPSGALSTTPIPCKSLKLPAGLQRNGAGPELMCAFESETDYVSIRVSTQLETSFKAAQVTEQGRTSGKVLIEPESADGWTFGARWPENGATTRVQWWLVDGKGQVLLCKMGSDRGDTGIAELGAVCDQARAQLYTP